MPEETGDTLCETQENVKGNGGKDAENCRVRGLFRFLVTSFQVTSYTYETSHKCLRNLHYFSRNKMVKVTWMYLTVEFSVAGTFWTMGR